MVNNCFHLRGFRVLFEQPSAAIPRAMPFGEQDNMDGFVNLGGSKMASLEQQFGDVLY